MTDMLKSMPAWGWLVLVLVAGTGVLAWHKFALDDQDTDWTTAKETPAPLALGAPGSAPMATGGGFRSRSYPGSLVAADFSIVGEC